VHSYYFLKLFFNTLFLLGIEVGDVILEVNEATLTEFDDFYSIIRAVERPLLIK
jgi:membrane-associated protease RseP (regulator of RpoE activity)